MSRRGRGAAILAAIRGGSRLGAARDAQAQAIGPKIGSLLVVQCRERIHREARRAGIQQARNVTVARNNGTVVKVTKS